MRARRSPLTCLLSQTLAKCETTTEKKNDPRDSRTASDQAAQEEQGNNERNPDGYSRKKARTIGVASVAAAPMA